MAKERVITRTIAVTEIVGSVIRLTKDAEPKIMNDNKDMLIGHYSDTSSALKAAREELEIHSDNYIKSWLTVSEIHTCYALVSLSERIFMREGQIINIAPTPETLRQKTEAEGVNNEQ